MKYLLAISLLFLTACDKEDENTACKGEAKYEYLQGNWVLPLGSDGVVSSKLRLTFDEPDKEEASVTYSCQNQDGLLASVTKPIVYIEHSPEQISLGYTGIMAPREKSLTCQSYAFGGNRYGYELKGECLILDMGSNKVEFTKGI